MSVRASFAASSVEGGVKIHTYCVTSMRLSRQMCDKNIYTIEFYYSMQ